jgi:hypothetical protein
VKTSRKVNRLLKQEPKGNVAPVFRVAVRVNVLSESINEPPWLLKRCLENPIGRLSADPTK